MKHLIFLCLFVSSMSAAQVGDLAKSQPAFQTTKGEAIVPIDISESYVKILFDPQTKTALGRAEIKFTTALYGKPMLLLHTPFRAATVDGTFLGSAGATQESTPDNANQVLVLNSVVSPGQHTAIIDYALKDNDVTYDGEGVRVGFWMTDFRVGWGTYLERYAPSNFEFDQFHLKLEVVVKGNEDHFVFSNGTVSSDSKNHWLIDFPTYFTSCSFYFHLTDQNIPSVKGNYSGVKSQIPITVYGQSANGLKKALNTVTRALGELEKNFGAYPNSSYLLYIGNAGAGLDGMEYSGAAVSANDDVAISHEVGHSWFGRSVMPALGPDEWFDESMMTWRDYGYGSREFSSNDHAFKLADFSPYELGTPGEAYTDALLAGLNAMLSNRGGLKPVMRDFYSQYQKTTITTKMLQNFLEQKTGANLEAIFAKYVYGKNGAQSVHINSKFKVSPEQMIQWR